MHWQPSTTNGLVGISAGRSGIGIVIGVHLSFALHALLSISSFPSPCVHFCVSLSPYLALPLPFHRVDLANDSGMCIGVCIYMSMSINIGIGMGVGIDISSARAKTLQTCTMPKLQCALGVRWEKE